MDLPKVCKLLLFPHAAVLVSLTPLSLTALVFAMLRCRSDSPLAIVAYLLSAYTLTLWCCRIPRLARGFRRFLDENGLIRRWKGDARLRVNVSLCTGLAFTTLYGILQLGLGFFYRTFWYGALGAYYICLSVMRLFLLQSTRRYAPGEHLQSELRRLRACGAVLLCMNPALVLIVFFMVYWDRTFEHHMITTITMAAYTFAALAAAIVSFVKYRRYRSPVLSAAKGIDLAAALVSMLILESTMLTVFADESMTEPLRRLMLGITGAVISAAVVAMAVSMLVFASKGLKKLNFEVTNGQS